MPMARATVLSMARIPIQATSWIYDDVSNSLHIIFTEMPASDHPDPANFVSTVTIETDIPLPRKAVVTNHPSQPVELVNEPVAPPVEAPGNAGKPGTNAGKGKKT